MFYKKKICLIGPAPNLLNTNLGKTIDKFEIVTDLDLKKGPMFLNKKLEIKSEIFIPSNLKIKNKKKIIINCKKYLICFINF